MLDILMQHNTSLAVQHAQAARILSLSFPA